MDFNFTDEMQMVEDMCKSFAEKEIAPYVDEDEANHHYRREKKNEKNGKEKSRKKK